MDLRRELVSIFEDVFQVALDAAADDVSAQEIGTWDSVNKLRLVLQLEETFEVEMTDEETLMLNSLADAERLLRRRGVGGGVAEDRSHAP